MDWDNLSDFLNKEKYSNHELNVARKFSYKWLVSIETEIVGEAYVEKTYVGKRAFIETKTEYNTPTYGELEIGKCSLYELSFKLYKCIDYMCMDINFEKNKTEAKLAVIEIKKRFEKSFKNLSEKIKIL